MPAPTYSTGTANVQNGNQVVNFGGGAALSAPDQTNPSVTLAICSAGDRLVVPGSGGGEATIQNVNSPTQITLETPWPGSNNAAAAYKIYRYTEPFKGAYAALAQKVLAQGSDDAPDLSRTIDNSVARGKLRIGSDGLFQAAAGPPLSADAALLIGWEIDPLTGVLSAPNGFKAPVVGFRNRLHNAGFNLWQRGTSITIAGGGVGYTADRWLFVNSSAVTATVSQINAPSGFVGPKALQWTAPNMAAGTSCDIVQRCEGLALQDMDTRGTALSFDMSAVTTAGSLSALIYITVNTALDNGTFTTLLYQASFAIPLGASRVKLPPIPPLASGLKLGAAVGIRVQQNNAAGTPTVQIGAVQYEKGTAVNDFEFRPAVVETMQCLRFAEAVGAGSIAALLSATQGIVIGRLFPKRATPTLSKLSEFTLLEMYPALTTFISSSGAIYGTTTTNPTEFGLFINGFSGMPTSGIGVMQSDSFLASSDL